MPAVREAPRPWDRHRVRGLASLLLWLALSGCAGFQERLVYDDHGVRIGIQPDPSATDTAPPALNSHPARLSAEEVRTLLRMLRVSGYSGIVGGLLVSPKPIPVFADDELALVAEPVTSALSRAGPRERVFFSLPNLRAPYERDRTSGALFVRGPYLHVILTDHAAFTRADTGGGEDDRDLRDTKGMKLLIASPASAAALSPGQTPHWAPFDKVHVSLNVQEALTAQSSRPVPSLPLAPVPQAPLQQPAPSPQQAAPQAPPSKPLPGDSSEDMRLLLRELTTTNQELRSRLKEQAQDLQTLQEEVSRLRQELEHAKARTKPLPGKKKPLP